MSTLSLTAGGSNLASSRGSSWTSGAAFQGAYGNNNPYCGVMRWPNLRSTVEWKDQVISKISLTLKFDSAGSNRTKNLRLCVAARNSFSGSYTTMPGTYIGTVSSGGAAYNSTRTITFTTGVGFNTLVDWLKNSSIYTLAVFLNESTPGSGDWSTNYLKITSATISVEYEASASKGSLDAESYNIGDTATLTVDPAEIDGATITHSAAWGCRSASAVTHTMGADDLTDTFTIPDSWLAQFAEGEPSVPATCTLTTYADGVQRGDPRVLDFTVNVGPKPIITDGSFSVKRYASRINQYGQTEYYESFTGNHVWVSFAARIVTNNTYTAANKKAWITYGNSSVNIPASYWSGLNVSAANDRNIITAAVPLGDSVGYVLHVSDGYNETTTEPFVVQKSETAAHMAYNGHAWCFGGFIDPGEVANDERFLRSMWDFQPMGGIGAVGRSRDSQAALGIQSGTITDMPSITGVGMKHVTFSPAYADGTTPVVVAGFNGTYGAAAFGSCAYTVDAVTNEGCDIYFYNNSGSAKTVKMSWIAVGVTEAGEEEVNPLNALNYLLGGMQFNDPGEQVPDDEALRYLTGGES